MSSAAPSSIDLNRHPIGDASYASACKRRLDADGALVLEGFVAETTVADVLADALDRERQAFYAGSTHNVYLTPPDAARAPTHAVNRQVPSSKGLIADDQIAPDSALRELYESPTFRRFLCQVLGIESIHAYADSLSSINVHFAAAGRELGWHFDNSSFAVTLLLQAPEAGGRFEYVPAARCSSRGDDGFDVVDAVLDGAHPVQTLKFSPGDLVLFRGRDALHRVTPTIGGTTRVLVVFAFNDEPGVSLSQSALQTFYGRTS